MICRQTTLIIVAVTLFSLTFIPHIAVGTSNFSTVSVVEPLVYVRVKTDTTSYLQGDTVKIYIYMVNNKDEPKQYPSCIEWQIFDSNGRGVGGYLLFINWASPIPTVPPHNETLFQTSLTSGDSTLEWNQKDYNRKTVSVGTYTIRVSFTGFEKSASSEITIRIYPNLDGYTRRAKWGFY